MIFDDVYNGKKVLVTGHTGFKGSWLTTWLLKLGADVTGISRDIPTQPAMFNELALQEHIKHHVLDIQDTAAIKKIILAEQPDFVFHLAAQAIVSTSYADPVDTISTNVIGTMNILEALRGLEHKCTAILITSDKCYDNVEWVWGYRETDALGGKDVYSGSKAAAEMVIKSYLHSFFSTGHPVRLAVGRAGNVIGGGDWAKDRIVVDCMRAWSEGHNVKIRSPQATRPWQHVLEPLSGYLTLGQALSQRPDLHGEAFNFGPKAEQNRSVVDLISHLSRKWGFGSIVEAYQITDSIPFHEAGLLKLSCDKALSRLKWEATLDYEETIRLVGDWYAAYYLSSPDMYKLTLGQIAMYESEAAERRRVWAHS